MVEWAGGTLWQEAALIEQGGFDGAVVRRSSPQAAEEFLEGTRVQSGLEGIASEGVAQGHGGHGERQAGATNASADAGLCGAHAEGTAWASAGEDVGVRVAPKQSFLKQDAQALALRYARMWWRWISIGRG